jgi:hypothetical protein
MTVLACPRANTPTLANGGLKFTILVDGFIFFIDMQPVFIQYQQKKR